LGFVVGFMPWVVFWVLVGNAPFRIAAGVAFGLAAGAQLIMWVRGAPRRTLDVGNLAVFAVLALAAFVVPDDVLARWLQPLGNAGLLLIALVGVLIGRPFVREYATDTVDEATARSNGFRVITTGMTWLWVGVFAGMTASSLVPPIVDGAATVQDTDQVLSVVCYWVSPFTLTGLGGLASALFPRGSKGATRSSTLGQAEQPPPSPRPRHRPTSPPTGSFSMSPRGPATTSRSPSPSAGLRPERPRRSARPGWTSPAGRGGRRPASPPPPAWWTWPGTSRAATGAAQRRTR
jgi:hypothetical protein